MLLQHRVGVQGILIGFGACGGVSSLGLRVPDLGCRVQGLGFSVFGVLDLKQHAVALAASRVEPADPAPLQPSPIRDS